MTQLFSHINLSSSTDIHMVLGSSGCSFPLGILAANKCRCGNQQQQQMGACYYTKPIFPNCPFSHCSNAPVPPVVIVFKTFVNRSLLTQTSFYQDETHIIFPTAPIAFPVRCNYTHDIKMPMSPSGEACSRSPYEISCKA